MATVDWEFHKKQYAEAYAPKGVTKAEYARLFDLPANSARRVFSAIKVDKPKPETPTKKPSKANDVNAGVKAAITKKARQTAAKNRKKAVEKLSDRLLQGDHPEKSDHSAAKQKRSPTKVITPSGPLEINNTEKSDSCVDAAEGVDHASNSAVQNDHFLAEPAGDRPNNYDRLASLTFGACAEFLGLNPDIQAVAQMLCSTEGISKLQSGRLLQMTKLQNELKRDLEKDYAAGNPWKDGLGNVIPYKRAMAECVFAPSEQMTSLESSLNRALLVNKKLEMDKRAAHPLTKAEQVARVREAFELRDKNGLSALETARLLERDSIPLPVSLKLEVEKEISFMTPPVEEDGGITEEELERQSQEYIAMQNDKRNHWLPSRRAEISELFADELAHQRGELLTEGEFQEIERIDQGEAEDGLSEFQDGEFSEAGDDAVEETW